MRTQQELISRRVEIRVAGTVQGVGFRPFVYRLASELGLSGFVRNRVGEVLIEAEGRAETLERFLARLKEAAPPLSRIESVSARPIAPRGDRRFFIERSSASGAEDVAVAADAAPCADCARELLDPADRRFLYPFLNCTACGPRLTIVQGVPYDRLRTSMSSFIMCEDCRREYDDPGDRRFHAQPTACPACGPRLSALDADGKPAAGDPVELAVSALLEGKIVAVKSVGGYHLACDAANAGAVAELRRRKRRAHKAFAVMVAGEAQAERLCRLSPQERLLLASPQAPIVLLERRAGGAVAEAVHRASPWLGVMLPPSPLHHLLAQKADRPLVMTSGDATDEPIAFRDEEALERLRGVADLFLAHDRPIVMRCDDSVAAIEDGAPSLIRRARGYAPAPMALPRPLARPALAVGGQLKSVFALGSGCRAVLSQHQGDLDDYAVHRSFLENVERYEDLFRIRPKALACDLHPDYGSSRYAEQRAAAEGLPLTRVQHHHAHFASALADNGLEDAAIGVAFDGAGLGLDGAIWGGEFLSGGCASFARQARLRYVPMPGGEQAIREPWRMALSHLRDAGLAAYGLAQLAPERDVAAVLRLLNKTERAASTSSMGRLFDAVSAILGVCGRAGYEGQAAVELEWLAFAAPADERDYPFAISDDREMIIDPRPTIVAVVDELSRGVPSPLIARRFHSTVARLVDEACGKIRARTGLGRVALTGGVFANRLLAREAAARLRASGFDVLRHRRVPCNDGGLCLGQLAVLAAGGGAR